MSIPTPWIPRWSPFLAATQTTPPKYHLTLGVRRMQWMHDMGRYDVVECIKILPINKRKAELRPRNRMSASLLNALVKTRVIILRKGFVEQVFEWAVHVNSEGIIDRRTATRYAASHEQTVALQCRLNDRSCPWWQSGKIKSLAKKCNERTKLQITGLQTT